MSRDPAPPARLADRPRPPVRRVPAPCEDDLVARVAAARRTPRRYEQCPCDDLVMPVRRQSRKS